jgi:(2Fe-2S) ferredoxin
LIPSAPRRLTVLVCRGPTCGDKRGGHELYDSLAETIAARGLGEQVTLAQETCFGHCLQGPNILVCDTAVVEAAGGGLDLNAPSAVLYNRMTRADLQRVIDRHLAGGLVVRLFLNRPPIRDPT